MTEHQNGRGRKIILLSDGTGNSSGKLFKTNVWRLYAALDVSNASQVAFYNNGVGTSAIKPLAVLGGAFGWGLKRNVLDLYTFLCRNYKPGDRIYGFGFSRGAFTIRVLINFILSQGLVANQDSTDDLRRKAVRLYRKFRQERTKQIGLHTIARVVRDGFVWLGDCILRGRKYNQISTIPVKKIEFLGLWDTVDAYGLPVEELERGIDRFIWPLSLGDKVLHDDIVKACHALSIDDRRQTFHPLLWDESTLAEHEHTDKERLTQVWFAGVHANVGGGYPDDSLSSITLRWMMNEAGKKGLSFSPPSLAEINAKIAPYGPIYNSRAGLGTYYRYGPRHLDPPRDRQGACIPNPKIHETVIWRMVAGADAYAPLSLPNKLRIVIGPDNEEIETLAAQSMRSASPAQQTGGRQTNILHFENYRDAVKAEGDLFGSPAGQLANSIKKKRAADEFDALETPNDETLDLIWDTIWWRRIAYYSTLMMTALLLVWILTGDNSQWADPSFDTDEALRPFVAKASELVALFIPAALADYLGVLRKYPLFSFALVGLTLACVTWGVRLDRRIHERALAAWNKNWQSRRFGAFRSSIRARVVMMCCLLIFPLGLGVLSLAVAVFEGSGFAVLFYIIAIIFFIIASPIIAWGIALLRIWRRGEAGRKEIRGVALWTANKVRNSRWLLKLHHLTMEGVVPAVFAVVVFMAGFYIANRAAITAFGGLGWLCESVQSPSLSFETKNACQPTGFQVKAKKRYKIEVSEVQGWRDGRINPVASKIGPNGFETPWDEAPLMLLGVPMRRVASENWFQLFVRVGRTGDVVYKLGAGETVIEPTKSGELFLFVNDAVIGIPGLFGFFYDNNEGKAKITVTEL